MTPSERVILRVLLDEYVDPSDEPEGFGPYGRAGHRLGVPSSRVAEVVDLRIGFPVTRHLEWQSAEYRAVWQDHYDRIAQAVQ